MKTFTALVALFACSAIARPSSRLAPRDGVCPATLYSEALCCATDVAGLLGVDCSTAKSANSVSDFKSSCVGEGKGAKCCTIPLAGLGVLCNDPVGA